MDREVRRVEFETFRFDVDQSGDVVSVLNYLDLHDEDTSIIGGETEDLSAYIATKDDAMALAKAITVEYELGGYELVECTNEIPAVWILTWNKRLAENVLNPYDVMTVTVDARDCSVMSMKRNTVTPDETIPLLTENEAIQKTLNVQNRLGDPGVSSAVLTVFRPNYYWEDPTAIREEADYVRLAWRITLGDTSSVYVDARTGEILGGSQTLAVRARAVSAVPEFFRIQECVDLAVAGLSRLGYTHHLNPVNYWITQADIEYVLNESNLKGLYLTCHGEQTDNVAIISDSIDFVSGAWLLTSNDIESNYKFVFLDACRSSATDAFPCAFLGNNRTRKCFVGWNICITTTTAYYFNTQFWPLVGTMPILDAVLIARENSIGQGYADCNPGFSGDSSYYGWA